MRSKRCTLSTRSITRCRSSTIRNDVRADGAHHVAPAALSISACISDLEAMKPVLDLLRYLQSNAVPFVADGISSIPSSVEPRSLAALANVRQVQVTPVQLDHQVWLAVVEAGRTLQPDLVRQAFGERTVRRLHPEDQSLLFPGCSAGAIPPLGHLFGLPVMIDESLADASAISFSACSPDVTLTMRTSDLREMVRPVAAEISTLADVGLPQS